MAYLSKAIPQSTPIRAAAGRGSYLVDEDGTRYLDFTSGIGVTSTGHCHPQVVAAAQEQVGELIHGQYGMVKTRPLQRLVDELGKVLPPELEALFFGNSGAEAVEAAVRVARNHTGRTNVVVFQGGFHGRTTASSALTTSGARYRRAGSGPLPHGVVVAPVPSAARWGMTQEAATAFALAELDHLFATVTDPADIAAFLVEPVQGEAGYHVLPSEFLHGLQDRARAHGIVLIADEVQAGVGRTGKFWSHQHSGITPDAVVFAKGIASGFPLSGFATRAEIMDSALPGSQGGTYAGNAVSCAAAVATLQVIEQEDLLTNATTVGAELRKGLEELASRYPQIVDVRGLGLMIGVEFGTPDGDPLADELTAVIKETLARKVVMLKCGPYGTTVRIAPPLTLSSAEASEGLEAFGAALTAVFGPA